jgi:hypothetical protein
LLGLRARQPQPELLVEILVGSGRAHAHDVELADGHDVELAILQSQGRQQIIRHRCGRPGRGGTDPRQVTVVTPLSGRR